MQYSRAKFVQYLLPSMRDACCKPHTWRGGEVCSQQKIEEAKQVLREEKKGPERGEGASAEAESSVLPLIVPWSQQLLCS